jgi:glycosyltransferase involved in cell wall biosynthesis
MLAQLGETWVITRANNRPVIERTLHAAGPQPDLHFVYVDLPPHLRRWKRGQRGVRLYYLLWQWAALREAQRLAQAKPFDLAWHLTLANAWIGSLACRLGVPFVYGPVGGGVETPWKLTGTLGGRGALYEVLRTWARGFGRYANPLARSSWRRAVLILAQNDETRQWLPQRYRARTEVFPNVLLERVPEKVEEPQQRVMLFAGRLLPWKGTSIAISALEALPEWKLVVCGDGPDLGRLRRHATQRGVTDRVEFRGWVTRDEVLRTMHEESSVFVFPSLHDEAGWVVAEAIAAGLPVVCLDIGGPPAIAGTQFAVPPTSPQMTAARLAERVVATTTEADRSSIQARAGEFMIEQRLVLLSKLLETHVPTIIPSLSGRQARAG